MLFVVDRKDLDYQTHARVRPLREGRGQLEHLDRACSSGSSRTRTRGSSSRRSRSSPASSATNKGHAIYDGHVVIIFDECHRSQFGDMHTAITKAFKRYHLFGFTGTPIFAENAGTGGNPQLRTTEQAFGDKLHTYTIVDAITDKNVLPFRIDYVNTIKMPAGRHRQAGRRRSTPSGRCSRPERIGQVVGYILEHFDQKTKRSVSLHARRASGSRASTRCSRPPRSTRPSATTAEFASQQERAAAGRSG